MVFHSRVLITGRNGFTGRHLSRVLESAGYTVGGLSSNLLDSAALRLEVRNFSPDYVVHLAGISNSVHGSAEELYNTNVIGTLNLFEALRQFAGRVKRVVVASSAAVYGNAHAGKLDEALCPGPVSHYGCSKLSMEYMINAYRSEFDVIVTRPFNYTGVGHDRRFLIPKLVAAYKAGVTQLSLGNLNVAREFNDVRDVSSIYKQIMESKSLVGVVNVCSGRAVYLKDVIAELDEISGYNIEVLTDESLVRNNEIQVLCGDSSVLDSCFRVSWKYGIRDTLNWMYSAG